MNANLVGATIVFIACGLAACTTQAVDPMGSGGTTGGAGSSAGGSTGTGGSGLPTNDGVFCLAPEQMITDFTAVVDGGTLTEPRFGTFGTSWSGGGSAYGSLTGNLTDNDWHIMGTIADYSGFSLYFDNNVPGALMCNRLDASAFDGITFTIWGTTSGNMLTMGVGTLDDTVKSAWLDSIDAGTGMVKPGRCMPASGNGPYYHPGCADPTFMFPVTGTEASPQTVTARWSNFGGEPKAGVMPTDILTIYWNVAWMPPTTPYAVDIHIDNLAFIPK